MNDPLEFKQRWWSGISEEAKDFCRMLLNRDLTARPTAKEALKHPWLNGNSAERSTGADGGRRPACILVSRAVNWSVIAGG
jgi:calcium-dependent protein kinase